MIIRKKIDQASVLMAAKDKLLERQNLFQTQMKIIQLEKEKINKSQDLSNIRNRNLCLFASENDGKLKRAFRNTKVDKKQQNRNVEELNQIQISLQYLSDRKTTLQKLIVHLQRYHNFFRDVVQLLPSDYIKTSKDLVVEGFMSRFNSLIGVNKHLFKEMFQSSEKIKYWKGILDNVTNQQHSTVLEMSIRLILALTQTNESKKMFQFKNMHYFQYFSSIRKFVQQLGHILISIDNITNKCIYQYRTITPDEITFSKVGCLKTMRVDEKLSKIQDYLEYYADLINILSEEIPIKNKKLKEFIKRFKS